ncbi:MAG: hypothetical protein AAFW69_10850 [Pseudomonadota bacterium]
MRRAVSGAAACLALAGCEAARTVGGYDIPISETALSEPYPELIEVPNAPPPGETGPGVPDPVTGAIVTADLSATAAANQARAAALAGPVIPPSVRARMREAVRNRE